MTTTLISSLMDFLPIILIGCLFLFITLSMRHQKLDKEESQLKIARLDKKINDMLVDKVGEEFMPSEKKRMEVMAIDRQQEIAQIIEPELHNLGDAFTYCNRVKFYGAIDRIRLSLKED